MSGVTIEKKLVVVSRTLHVICFAATFCVSIAVLAIGSAIARSQDLRQVAAKQFAQSFGGELGQKFAQALIAFFAIIAIQACAGAFMQGMNLRVELAGRHR